MTKPNDGTNDEEKGSEQSENNDSDSGSDQKDSDKGNDEAKGLTKEAIQEMISGAMAAAVKDIITPEIDRRISGATKTIYKKTGVKDETSDESSDKANQEAGKLKDRLEIAAVYAETTIKEDTGKLTEEEQELVETLIAKEFSKVQVEEGQTVKDIGKLIGTNVLKTYKKFKEKIENNKIDALKKAGQIIEVSGPGRTEDKTDDFDRGRKMAEARHPKKT